METGSDGRGGGCREKAHGFLLSSRPSRLPRRHVHFILYCFRYLRAIHHKSIKHTRGMILSSLAVSMSCMHLFAAWLCRCLERVAEHEVELADLMYRAGVRSNTTEETTIFSLTTGCCRRNTEHHSLAGDSLG